MSYKMKSVESLRDLINTFTKKERHSSFGEEKKLLGPSKCQMVGQKTMGTNVQKNLELKKGSSNSTSTNGVTLHKKQSKKGEQSLQTPSSYETSPDLISWICKNSACKAVLTSEDTFCQRCSCCICHQFDDNKDPSLWLVCTSECSEQDSCGLSCHVECALQRQRVGVVDLGQLMQLDGSYCCAFCGKVSGIIGYWKKQLAIAKDARRVDVLCHRISLSYRLLDGTLRFKELHEIVRDAKSKVETEVGPLNGVSSKMARGIVSRLSVACDVQKLCSIAIEKADSRLCSIAASNPEDREESLPAACRFQFEDVTSSSLVMVLKETCFSASSSIKGYKLWYCKSGEQQREKKPVVFSITQRRILISNLQPCTEYSFRIISFTETGDLGHSESKCFTKSVEIIRKRSKNMGLEGGSHGTKREAKIRTTKTSGFKVRDLGKIIRLAWAHEQGCPDGSCSDVEEEESCGGGEIMQLKTAEGDIPRPSVPHRLDLNVVSIPDLNAELTQSLECSPDEENGCTSEKERSNGSGDSQTGNITKVREVPAVESRSDPCRKRAASTNEVNYDCASTLVSGSSLRFANGSGLLDDYYEYCVKIVRWLECEGHIEKDFRMKFLTWFSLRSTEQERRVVHTFINTLVDDPSSLAGQLVDSFLEIITCKRLRNGFCSKLWH